MTSGGWPLINPYQAPAEAPPPILEVSLTDELRGKLAAFRQQIHAIGGGWILLGFILLSIGPGPGRIAVAIIGAVGLTWIVAGIAACLKQPWGVYLGIGINYLTLLACVLRIDLCSSLLLIVVLIQAHRVLRWAKEFIATGIPLGTKP
jgi:hypothetical protein